MAPLRSIIRLGGRFIKLPGIGRAVGVTSPTLLPHEGFAFLNPHICWGLEEFVRESPHRGQWVAYGLMVFMLTETDVYLFVRTWDKVQALTQHHLHPLSCGYNFYCQLLDVKIDEEIERGRAWLKRPRAFYNDRELKERRILLATMGSNIFFLLSVRSPTPATLLMPPYALLTCWAI